MQEGFSMVELARQRLKYLDNISSILQDAVRTSPAGSLVLRNTKLNGLQLYMRKNGTEIYIPFSEAGPLATKRYHIYVLKLVDQEIGALEKYLKAMPKIRFEDALAQVPDPIKPLISPAIMTDEEYARRWQAEIYTGKGFDPKDTTEFYTRKGERVRSKSEVLIANALYDLGIPYKYECPLVLYDGRLIIHPDFTILNMRTREVYYLEHAGRIDKESYAKSFVLRLKYYTDNGIFFGDRLLFTFESDDMPLSTKDLDAFLRHYFL